jgi:hypothetical protein
METSFQPLNTDSEFNLPTYPKLTPVIKNMSRMRYGRDLNSVSEEIIQRGDLKSKEKSD